MKHCRAALIPLLLALMGIAVTHLYFERGMWKLHLRSMAANAGRLQAVDDFRRHSYSYYRVDGKGSANFSGRLIDGVELWDYPSDSENPFHGPGTLSAETYVDSFNDEMRRRIQTLQPPPSAVRKRAEDLRSENWEDREKAARMLGAMGKAAREAIPDLIVAMRDEKPEVRAAAASAIGRIGASDHNDQAIVALEELRKTPNAQMQEITSRALDNLKKSRGTNPYDAK